MTTEGALVATANESQATAPLTREATFNRLVTDRALDAAYRYATILLGNTSDAEDAVLDAALAAWRHLGDLRDESKFDAWFGRIVVNACRDRMRARRNVLTLDDERSVPQALHPTGGDPADAAAHRQAIAAALRRLSRDHLEVVILRFYLDLSIDQIAARIGTRPGTVQSRLHHALRELRSIVGPDYAGRWEA